MVWPAPSVPFGEVVDLAQLDRGVGGRHRVRDRPAVLRAGLWPVVQAEHGGDHTGQGGGHAQPAAAVPVLHPAADRVGAGRLLQGGAEDLAEQSRRCRRPGPAGWPASASTTWAPRAVTVEVTSSRSAGSAPYRAANSAGGSGELSTSSGTSARRRTTRVTVSGLSGSSGATGATSGAGGRSLPGSGLQVQIVRVRGGIGHGSGLPHRADSSPGQACRAARARRPPALPELAASAGLWPRVREGSHSGRVQAP